MLLVSIKSVLKRTNNMVKIMKIIVNTCVGKGGGGDKYCMINFSESDQGKVITVCSQCKILAK